jgi:DnaJ-class molecular chaperone
MDVNFILAVEQRAAALEELDYFQVLEIPYESGAAEVRAAYHRQSRALHPDRYAALPSPELRALVGRVYRRVTEAYTVLRDDEKRRRYLADVRGADRASKLRFTEDDAAALKERQARRLEEQVGQTPNGRKLYATALEQAQRQQWDAAARSIRTALVYEPGNARFKELASSIEKSRPKVDPYKIR